MKKNSQPTKYFSCTILIIAYLKINLIHASQFCKSNDVLLTWRVERSRASLCCKFIAKVQGPWEKPGNMKMVKIIILCSTHYLLGNCWRELLVPISVGADYMDLDTSLT